MGHGPKRTKLGMAIYCPPPQPLEDLHVSSADRAPTGNKSVNAVVLVTKSTASGMDTLCTLDSKLQGF